MAERNALYSDLDLALTRHPLSRDVVAVTDEQAVRRCILRIPKMRRFDVPFEPDKAAWIEEFLFEPLSVATAAALTDRITWALNKMEPRATYKVVVTPSTVELSSGKQGYDCVVHYTITSIMVEGDVRMFLERVR